MQVPFDGLMIFFTVLQILCVERSRWLFDLHAVVEPLLFGKFEERAPKTISVFSAGDGKPVGTQGGRAVRRKCRIFDSTRGFPGEDVAA